MRNFDFRYVTFISVRDVLNVGVSARDVLNVGFSARDVLNVGFLGFFIIGFIEIILLFRCLSRKNRKTGFLLSWKAKDLGGFRRI